ncbi:amidohydrolase [Tenacibaculum sp. nBUS_03]|uniref:amidohydrolase n=1 Tax=Tenacibaculum sp. nBUS_03 TaxID=3395320 RepID=UPI003EBC2F6A
MTKKLSVALIQSDLVWENPIANRMSFEEKIKGITAKVDLIILPEMFTTGFTMNASENAETMEGETIQWMKGIATTLDVAVIGSIIIKEHENYYNRLLFIHPSEEIETYNKKHTFTLAKEHETYTAGQNNILIEFKGWRIRPLICYDLRFPVWARNTDNYDVLLYIASWPKPRINAWDSLLKARAIENMSYTIGVNRVGVDANNYEYSGNSICYDTLGNCLAKSDKGEESILIVELDKQVQNNYRDKFRFLEDGDAFRFI